jgi:AraC-like DNA-binding protein
MPDVLIDPTNERKIVDFRPLGLRDVAALGRYAYARAHRPLGRHTHGDLMEICYLDEGVQPYSVEGQEYVLKGGDVLVVFPRESHGTGRSPENRGRLYWMILRLPRPGKPFLGLPPAEAREMAGALRGLSPRRFRGGRGLKRSLERIFEAHDGGGALRRAEISNWTLRFLLDVLAASRRCREEGVSPAVREAQALIEAALGEETPRLEALAERVGLSLSWFNARFKREVGVAPRNYIVMRKVEEAKRRLARPGASVTGVAMGLGFSTSQYFATVFRRYTGMTPGEFRRSTSARAASSPPRPRASRGSGPSPARPRP